MTNFKSQEIREPEYGDWLERSVLADCFRDANLVGMAEAIMEYPLNIATTNKLISIIKKHAELNHQHTILIRLYKHGLIQG
jgi:hypothetical protein